MRATKAIVHLDNVQSNLAEICKKLGPKVKVCVPVKADAYGHGALRIAVTALRAGASHLAVATAQEGVDLREAGIVAPILVLGICLPDETADLVRYGITPFIADEDYLDELDKAAAGQKKSIDAHLKIDSGMGRIGCRPEEAASLAKSFAKRKNVRLAGVATHLAVADSLAESDVAFTKNQISRFSAAVDSIRAAGIDPGIVHASNSAAIIRYPEAQFDMVRPGIIVYGYPPSAELEGMMRLQPVMELQTKVVHVKKVTAGTPISYGRTWVAPEDTFIATIPVGYGDGLPRRLSSGFSVRIGEESFPIVGRICMDQCMVNIGPDPWVQRWDTVTVFGPDPLGASAKTLADSLGTISYEITCGINKRVPRVYVGDL